MGYDEVYNLGGFNDWAESGGAVDKADRAQTSNSGRAPHRSARGPPFEWTGSLCSPQDSGAVRSYGLRRQA